MGRWELIIAITIFAVNGLLGYLAKRQKEQARRQAELEAAGVEAPPKPAPEKVRGRTARSGPKKKVPSDRRAAEVRADGRSNAPSARKATPAGKANRPTPPPAKRPTVVPGGMRVRTDATPARTPAPPLTKSPPPAVRSAAVPASAAGVGSDRLRSRLRDGASLRELFVAAELLGRPRGLPDTGPDPNRPG